jgi:hypothetical protein
LIRFVAVAGVPCQLGVEPVERESTSSKRFDELDMAAGDMSEDLPLTRLDWFYIPLL